MATIQRPVKTYGTRRYVDEVAAAPLNEDPILANEVDGDLDTVYAAWNGGADTVNIKDGAVTTPKIAADAVTASTIADQNVRGSFDGAAHEIQQLSIHGGFDLVNATVSVGKLIPGTAVRQVITVTVAAGFSSNTAAWADVVTPISITTAGGALLLIAAGGWCATNSTTALGTVALGWGRDALSPNIFVRGHDIQMGTAALYRVPIPIVMAFDQPSAGAHGYHLLVSCSGGMTFYTTSPSAGTVWVVELA